MIDWCPAARPNEGAGAADRTERRLLALALAGQVDAERSVPAAGSRRAAEVTRALARRMGWADRSTALLFEAALLQDVGYAALPHGVLAAAAPLGGDDQAVLARHPVFGAELLRGVLTPEQLGWVRHHHERWDGSGYPDGLAGNDIPEGASLILLGAAWASMTDGRPGRPGRDVAEALRECRLEAGRQFRPSAVAALMGLAGRPRGRVRQALFRAEQIAC